MCLFSLVLAGEIEARFTEVTMYFQVEVCQEIFCEL